MYCMSITSERDLTNNQTVIKYKFDLLLVFNLLVFNTGQEESNKNGSLQFFCHIPPLTTSLFGLLMRFCNLNL